MQASLYVALSAQRSMQKRLDTIANNVANATTAGYRAEAVKFDTLVSQTLGEPTAFSTANARYLSRRSGEFVKTDNPLDVAIEGSAWISIQTPAGQVFTRDGRMRMAETGQLQTLNGYPILDAGGAPILLDPSAGPPQIAHDGMITQNRRQIGAIGLFSIDDTAKLNRFENSGVIPDRPASAVLDFRTSGVRQGFVERSNVNPVTEISTLMALQRTFEAAAASINDMENSLQDAIKTLGSNS